MKTIGLVGGIASGKSLAADVFRRLGAHVIDADRLGHAVLAEDPDVRDAIRSRWGDGVLSADGSIDRRAVAARVFAPSPEGAADRAFLEGLLHPPIRQRMEAERAAVAAAGATAVVVDAALLFEAGWNTVCNQVIFIDAPPAALRERARKRGWTDADFAAREAAQWPVGDKRRRADVVIPNDGTPDDLDRAIRAFWDAQVAE